MNALNKKTVDDINVKGQKVLVRCDFNVPLKNGVITDENRIIAALPTIKKLIADGGRVILCSHLGKPKGEPKPELSLAPVAKRLSELLGKEVVFAGDGAIIHSEKIKSSGESGWSIAPQHLILPKASSVAYAALKRAQKGDFDDVYTLNPVYLRKSQAEREREERENKGE